MGNITTNRIVAVAAALISAMSVARAEDAADLPFDEQYVCRNERSSAHAAAQVTPAPNDAAAVAGVERARRDLARATKGRDKYKQWLDEAVAQLEAVRAAWRTSIARRDASARTLAECIDAERSAYLARAAAKQAEKQRRAEEETAKRERVEKLMSSKPVVQLALSALVCVTNNERAGALRAIADEKKYARLGGVQNNTKIYELQQSIRESDQRVARFSRELKTRNASATRCSDPKVRQVATCITAAIEDGPCLVDDVKGPLQVVRVIEGVE